MMKSNPIAVVLFPFCYLQPCSFYFYFLVHRIDVAANVLRPSVHTLFPNRVNRIDDENDENFKEKETRNQNYSLIRDDRNGASSSSSSSSFKSFASETNRTTKESQTDDTDDDVGDLLPDKDNTDNYSTVIDALDRGDGSSNMFKKEKHTLGQNNNDFALPDNSFMEKLNKIEDNE